MVQNKSLDPYLRIIIALLCDVRKSHSEVFTPRACRLTVQKIEKRCAREGMGFLTKTLPRLGKALDRALSGKVPLDSSKLALASLPNSKLPMLFGELFQRIFAHDGWILPIPCVQSIKSLRQLLFVFYKLELPYEDSQEQKVLQTFERTDEELGSWNKRFEEIRSAVDRDPLAFDRIRPIAGQKIVRGARKLLAKLFSSLDVMDIHPAHGPGAVSTKETMSEKYVWKRVSKRLTKMYPLDAYFYASLGHVCDSIGEINSLSDSEHPAQVLLVPKDSRGPRIISCEPLENQWIQQGLRRAIYKLVETHPLTRYAVHFTDQVPNQKGALLGSYNGRYATLDLKEASDRVSIGLVRLLFPEPILSAMEACRSESTTMPDGRTIKLNKFAPMGSALCFPIMALSIWALLAVGLSDADPDMGTRQFLQRVEELVEDRILVYGDDVVVPSAKAENAMSILESFGLLVNRDKSFYSGSFRESCGVDAYKGIDVTPVRFRTCWKSRRCPEAYASYIAYANALYELKFYQTYDLIVSYLTKLYGEIPERSMWPYLEPPVPSLVEVPEAFRPKRSRTARDRQGEIPFGPKQWYVTTLQTRKDNQEIGGWNMLLRYFSEATDQTPLGLPNEDLADAVNRPPLPTLVDKEAFSVRTYTKRGASYLVKRWR